MRHPFILTGALCLVLLPQAAGAQAKAYVTAAKAQSDLVKGNIVKAAEKMPEEHYAFKPVPEVRSYGQLLGHIADASFMICSRAAGTDNPSKTSTEKTATTKAALAKALNEAFAYCDGVFAKLDDTSGAEMIKFFTGPQPKLSALSFNTAHNFEHYGNLVTYLRMKGIVPPSSEGQ
jgi:uncharacterized damage-inducible protein DinB